MRRSWRNLPTHQNWWEDQLFVTALNYVTDNTYTHTLNVDTYPVQITPEYVVPGTIFLYIGTQSGHTRMLYRFGPSAQISMLYSTVPRTVRALGTEVFRPSTAPPVGKGGLVKFRWPYMQNNQWRLTAASAMRGYSLEQHQPTFPEQGEYFYQAVHRRVFGNLIDRDLDDMRTGIETLKAQFEARIAIVQNGYNFCRQNDCSPGSAGYEDWSTPSRDGRTRETIQQLNGLLQASQDPRVRQLWNSTASTYVLEVDAGFSLRWSNLVSVFQTQATSFDPNAPVANRWGVQSVDHFRIESEHPYANSIDVNWNLRVPNGQNIQLVFDLFDLEDRYDYVTITDAQGRSTRFTGSHAGGLVTPTIEGGGLITINFNTDSSVVRQGFRVQRIDLVP